MKVRKFGFLAIIAFTGVIMLAACTKTGGDTSQLYVPGSSDVTANATLEELQQGRALYIGNCNACHGLYNPDSNTPTQWRSIMSNMAPRTSMSAAEVQLVTKYLTRGN